MRMPRYSLALVAAVFFSAAALGQTVTVSLVSPQDGQSVAPGSTIDWQIVFTVSSGDNAGLALLAADLVQDADNAALFNIPPADGVPAAMSNFSRPDGVSNPGESDPITGYIGVQRGPANAANLVQIGGGQNTFGVARPPGTGIAESANVIGGVGQFGAEVLASGSFVAPDACGESFKFSLENVLANVLLQVNSPPSPSLVTDALVVVADSEFSFIVGLLGDINGDGTVGLADLSILLTNFGISSGMTYEDGDLDGDGGVGLSDLSILLGNFGLGC